MARKSTNRSFRASKEWKNSEIAIKRTQDTCVICGGYVDTSLPPKLPESPEIEHFIPISRGGNPLHRSNLGLCHRLCNQKKGNKLLSEYKATVPPLKTEPVARNRRRRSWDE